MARSSSSAFAFGGAPRVNLMPRAAIERRERSALLRRWGWMLAAALVVVGLLGGGAYTLQTLAQHRLDAANAKTTELIATMAALQPVQQKLTLQDELSTFREQAMATDLSWRSLVATLEDSLPPRTAFIELRLAPGGVPIGEDPTTETGVTGEVVVRGMAADEIDGLIRAARDLPGVVEADGWTQEYREGGYRHTLRIVIDQSVYTGDYAKEVAP